MRARVINVRSVVEWVGGDTTASLGIVECHEIWSYDDRKKVQTLKGLIALCPTCHKAKHLGRTLSVEKPPVRDKVLIHILEQNEMTVDELEAYIVEVFEEHSERSRHQWKIDLSWLES